jgi:alkylation response protein AidB-like acyl-CoA dehydrogenase
VAKAVELAAGDVLRKKWLPKIMGGCSLGAFAVHEPDSGSNADSAPGTAAINGFKAKLFASEAAVEITNSAIQVLGGHGYCRDYVVERLFRDARGLTLHFKTSEWLRQDIAKAALTL